MASVAAAALASPALAQTKAPDPKAKPAEAAVEEVVVTGSLFAQTVTQSQLVTTIDETQLRNTGATSAFEALGTIAQNQPTVTAASAGPGTGFATYANLRSLGSSSTLVLFDGRRVVNNPIQTVGVDLNTLPLNLIERVETLSDGASSIYGSDAIAGVINFIPKREVKGLSISATMLQPEEDGGRNNQFSISGGLGSLSEDGWNIYAGYTWRKKDALHARDRDFADSLYIPERGVSRLQGTTFPSNYAQPPTLANVNPSRPGCNPPTSVFIGGTTCFFEFSPLVDVLPSQEDTSILVHGIAKVANQTVTAAFLHSTDRTVNAIAPYQVPGATMTPSNPFFPGRGITPGEPGLNPNAPILVSWRVLEAGPLVTGVKDRTDRVNAEVKGEVLGWDYQTWGLYSESKVDSIFFKGFLSQLGLRAGLTGSNGAPFLNPFGPQTAAGAQYLRDNAANGLFQTATGKLTMFGGQVSRNLFDLPAGPVQFALAADYKDESSKFDTKQIGITTGFAPSLTVIDADRQSYSVTSEVKIPILETFDIDASLRYDHYSDFGSTTNPKVLATWRATDWLTVHGSYNKGFRAPTLYNVSSPDVLSPTRDRRPDPVLCPGGVVNTAGGGVAARDCGTSPYNIRSGGNPNLGPEKSDAYSVGFELRPTDSLRIGVDYWNYHLKETIAPLAEVAIFADLAKFGSLVVRCSQAEPALAVISPNCAPGHIGDPIAYVDQRPQNLGDTKTDGVDIHAVWRGPEMSWGQVTLEYNATYVLGYDFQRVPGGPYFSRKGAYFDLFPVIEYSHYAAATWRKDDWTVQLSNRLLGSYDDCNAQCGIAAQYHQKVGAYSLWNVSVTRTLGKATITGRITNILDTDPPFTNKTQNTGTGWDERYTDPIGRAYSLTLRYDF